MDIIDHILIANVKLHYDAIPCIIKPYAIEDTNLVSFYWETGPSKCAARLVNGDPGDGEFSILEDWGIEGSFSWEELDLHFLKTYYPANPIMPVADTNGSFYGWIDPDGNYYMAHYGNHDATAQCIYATLYNEVLSGYEAREKLLKTWIQLNKTFIIGRNDFKIDQYDITVAQTKTVDYVKSISGLELDYEFRKIV